MTLTAGLLGCLLLFSLRAGAQAGPHKARAKDVRDDRAAEFLRRDEDPAEPARIESWEIIGPQQVCLWFGDEFWIAGRYDFLKLDKYLRMYDFYVHELQRTKDEHEQSKRSEERFRASRPVDAPWRAQADREEEKVHREIVRELEEKLAKLAGTVYRKYPQSDLDGDGSLSPEEIAALYRGHVAQRRAAFLEQHPRHDLDGDGVFSDYEVEAVADARRQARLESVLRSSPEADRDRDAALSEDEYEAYLRTRAVQRGSRPEPASARLKPLVSMRFSTGTGDSGPLFDRMQEYMALFKGLRALIEEYNEAGVPLEDVVDELWAGHEWQCLEDEKSDWREALDQKDRLQAERLARADRDGDGRLSKIEDLLEQARDLNVDLRQTILEQHPDADLNRDGRLSDDELDAFGPRIKSYSCTLMQASHTEQDIQIQGKRAIHREPRVQNTRKNIIKIMVHEGPAGKTEP
jgi:hypothetical protein